MTRLLKKFPYFISHFLGYRKPNYVPKKLPQWRIYFWSFLAAWIGIGLLEIIFTYSKSFQNYHTPMIIASFGAGAVLLYGVIDSPLAQPRNVICGQLVGSIVGVIIAQLFLTIEQNWTSTGQKQVVEWVGGATAMALALTVMQLTKTVHPPGGATALIAVITPTIVDISWFYIAIVFVSSITQVVIACLINNIERKYPQYWWSPYEAIKLGSATLATLMPNTDDHQKEEVAANKLTVAEEGILNNKVDLPAFKSSATSSSITLQTTNNVDGALCVLQKYVESSRTPYLVISQSLIATADIELDEKERNVLQGLVQKLNAATHNM
ncbi:HPP family-domain-containing protein, partial [Thamnidium elegans]